jgi:hypothetical protein
LSSRIRKPETVLLSLILLSSLLLGLTTASLIRASNGTPSFVNFELGPFNNSGTTCPNLSMNCWNQNAEPQIRADHAGNFYASSEYLPRITQCSNGLDLTNPACGGTGAWKSSDGGLHYTTLPSPNSHSLNGTSLSPYGGDTDLATAPIKNAAGFYNVYVISLERATGPLISVEASTSQDGGQTWMLNPTGATIPLDDRPWVAADGSSKVCVSYHAVATTNDIFVTCSNDAGTTFPQVGNAFDSNHLWLADFNNGIGNLAIDSNTHVIYQTFDGLATQSEALQCAVSCSIGTHAVWVAVSIDGGKTFTDNVVYNNPNTSVSYGHQFTSVSVDKAGNVYIAYTDDHNTFYSFSQDFGNTWSGPFQVNNAPANTAIFPWITAGNPGMIDIAYYGTSYYDGVNTPDNYPMSAVWYAYMAQNLKALTPSSSFSQTQATPIIHYGGVCEAGVSCTGNRDLFDDFGIAASPITGLASIVYSDDQYVNSANEPASPTCTQAKTNTNSCDRTNIATQVSGSGIFQKVKGFEIHGQHLNEIGSAPSLTLSITNTATLSITSLTIQLNNAAISLNWDNAPPSAPDTTITGTDTSIPTSLLLSVAGVYPLTVTATYSDGSEVTQTVSIIYTLY